MRQLLEAVEFIHSKFIVHRDLKVRFPFVYVVNKNNLVNSMHIVIGIIIIIIIIYFLYSVKSTMCSKTLYNMNIIHYIK